MILTTLFGQNVELPAAWGILIAFYRQTRKKAIFVFIALETFLCHLLYNVIKKRRFPI